MSEIIEKARACYLECEQMDSDGIVETIAKYIEAETADLRRALEPFANVYEKDISVHDDDADLFQPMTTHNRAPRLTAGDFRRAYAAHQVEAKQ